MRHLYEVKAAQSSDARLVALDRGAYREAIPRYEETEPSSDAIDTLWRADVALYLERLEDAATLLESLQSSLDRDAANRARILRAEHAFYSGSLDEAVELVTPIIQSTWEAGDDQGHLRASLLPARVALRRGETDEALEKLKEPRRLATLLANDFYTGFISHCRGFAYYRHGDYRRSGQCFSEALVLLTASEHGRWEAACRNVYGSLLADLGQYDEALAHFETSERMALELGVISEALYARNNAAGTLFALRRFDETIERYQNALPWHRENRAIFAEIQGLQTLAQAYGETGRFAEAERAASESIRLARLANSSLSILDGELIEAWAAGRIERPGAAESMLGFIAKCDATGNEIQRLEARLFTADVLASTAPDIAFALCREARAIPACEESRRLLNLLDRVERALAAGPIRIGPSGELVIDPHRGWPDYDSAMEAVKRFLVGGAVDSSEGNRSEAARKLNLTRSRMHDLWRQIHGEPVRPRRNADARSESSSLRN